MELGRHDDEPVSELLALGVLHLPAIVILADDTVIG